MGIMNKMKPKKASHAKTMQPLPVTAGGPARASGPQAVGADPEAPTAPLVTSAAAGADHDDDPTYFTTFMILYYGFFGITMLVYPSVHAADGPFPNPLAYFTTISDEQTFTFRMVGAAFITLVLGPFLDDIFGGAGVTFMAFARQLCVINTIFLFLFLYYAYYAPLANAVPFMWNIQAIMNGLIFAWNVIETCPSALPTYYTRATVAMFGFFAVALVSIPNVLFGPPSPIAYWNEWTELGLMCARSLGISMGCVFIGGYYLCGTTAGYAKLCTVWNVLIFGLVAVPAYFGGDSSVASMWEIQFVLQIPFVVVGLYMEGKGTTGKWPVAFSCGRLLDASTFCVVNVIFYVPFVLAFCTVPNLVFGPETPTGMPMFNTELDETALWFGRTWAINIFLLCLGPFLFGFPVLHATKLLTASYLLFCALFAYAVLSYSVLNLIVIGPLCGLNVLFFGVGLYISLTSTDGEQTLYMA